MTSCKDRSLKKSQFYKQNAKKITNDTVLNHIQLASSVPGRIAFYGVIWGRFDHLEILLKVLKTSFSFLTLINIDQNFHENKFWSCRPRGCKTVGPQSFAATGSRKSDVVAFPRLNLLCSGARENTRKNPKCLELPNSSVHSFAAHWARSLNYLSFKILINIYLEPEGEGRSMIFKPFYVKSKYP